MVEPEPRSKARLSALDASRFFACLAVVMYHWLYGGIANGKVDSIELSGISAVARYGYLGVHLFFLISGFVISISVSGKSAGQFAVGRVVRLYPTFWVAMSITVVVSAFIGGDILNVTPVEYFANLTMVSRIFGQPYVDGVYWTLFLELAFYLLAFFLIATKLSRWWDQIIVGWSVLILVVNLLLPRYSESVYVGGLFSLFAGGAIIASMQKRGWRPLLLAGLAASLLSSALYVYRHAEVDAVIPENVWISLTILLSAYLVLAAQAFVPWVRDLVIPGSLVLGALTYPVYLLHAHISYMVFDRYSNEGNKWAVYAVMLVLIIGLSYGLHWLIEKRMRRTWFAVFNTTIGRPIDGLIHRIRSLLERGRSKVISIERSTENSS